MLVLGFLGLGLFCGKRGDLSRGLDNCRANFHATKTVRHEGIGKLRRVGCWGISDCIFQISDWGRCGGDLVMGWGKNSLRPFDDGQGRAEAEFLLVLSVWIGLWRTMDFVRFAGLNDFGGWQRCF